MKKAAKGEGYLFRRKKGRDIPLASDPSATIYYQLRSDGEKVRLCCHTADETVARRLIQTHLIDIDLTTPEKFLKTLANAGATARKKLDARPEDLPPTSDP